MEWKGLLCGGGASGEKLAKAKQKASLCIKEDCPTKELRLGSFFPTPGPSPQGRFSEANLSS